MSLSPIKRVTHQEEIPWDWEISENGSSTFERTVKLGKTSLDFKERERDKILEKGGGGRGGGGGGGGGGKNKKKTKNKDRKNGVKNKDTTNPSDAGNNTNSENESWKVIEKLGRDKMELQPGLDPNKSKPLNRVERVEEEGFDVVNYNATGDGSDDESSSSSASDSGGSSDSDSDLNTNQTSQRRGKSKGEDKKELNASLQTDANALLDIAWDTSNYTLIELEGSASELISKLEDAPLLHLLDRPHPHPPSTSSTAGNKKTRTIQKTTLKMLTRLLTLHTPVRNYFHNITESLVQKCLPASLVKGLKPQSFNLIKLLCVALGISSSGGGTSFRSVFNSFGCCLDCVRVVSWGVDVAATVLQVCLVRVPNARRLLKVEIKNERVDRENKVKGQLKVQTSDSANVNDDDDDDDEDEDEDSDSEYNHLTNIERFKRTTVNLNLRVTEVLKAWRRARNSNNYGTRNASDMDTPVYKISKESRRDYLEFLDFMCSPSPSTSSDGDGNGDGDGNNDVGKLCGGSDGRSCDQNRRDVCSGGGLIVIGLCISEFRCARQSQSQSKLELDTKHVHVIATTLLRNLARTKSLLYSILKSGVCKSLQRILDNDDNDDDVIGALKVFNTLSFNASLVSSCLLGEDYYDDKLKDDLQSCSDSYTAHGNASGNGEDNIDINIDIDIPPELTDTRDKHYYRKATRHAIAHNLTSASLLTTLTSLLEHTKNTTIFTLVCTILTRLACTSAGYPAVLTAVVCTGGLTLNTLVNNLQSSDPHVPQAVLTLVRQVCTLEYGRGKVISAGGVGMLLEYVEGSGEGLCDSVTYFRALLGLVCLCSDSDDDRIDLDFHSHDNDTAINVIKETYKKLLTILTSPNAHNKSPLNSTLAMLHLSILPHVLNFLTRPDLPSGVNFLALSVDEKWAGAIILHRLSRCARAVGRMCDECVVDYFCFVGQFNHTYDSSSGKERRNVLYHPSTQAALNGLANIAKSSLNGAEMVKGAVYRSNVIAEINALLVPSKSSSDTFIQIHSKQRLITTIQALNLITSIATAPVYNDHPVLLRESYLSVKEDTASVIDGLVMLCKGFCGGVVGGLFYSHSLHTSTTSSSGKGKSGKKERNELIATTCRALTKLASTDVTADVVIQEGVVKGLVGLFPNRPTIIGCEEEKMKTKTDKDKCKLLNVNAAVFELVGTLARTNLGRVAIQNTGLLKRCLERFHLSSSSFDHDHDHDRDGDEDDDDKEVKGAIAMLITRIANTHNNKNSMAGSSNDFILYSPSPSSTNNNNNNTIKALISLSKRKSRCPSPTINKSKSKNRSRRCRRTRYWAVMALNELCRDTIRVIPLVVKMGLIEVLRGIVGDYVGSLSGSGSGSDNSNDANVVPLPLLRPALTALLLIAKYPLSPYTSLLTSSTSTFDSNNSTFNNSTSLIKNLQVISSSVSLQKEYESVKDRMTLGDIARDLLFLITDGDYAGDRNGNESGSGSESDGGVDGVDEGVNEGVNDDDFVRADEDEDEDEDENDIVAIDNVEPSQFNGSYTSMGVTTSGSLFPAPAKNVDETADADGDVGADLDGDDGKGQGQSHVTRLAMLDAEDRGFRNELKRRKEYYGMLDGDGGGGGGGGGGGVKNGRNGEVKKQPKNITKKKIETVKELRISLPNLSDDDGNDDDVVYDRDGEKEKHDRHLVIEELTTPLNDTNDDNNNNNNGNTVPANYKYNKHVNPATPSQMKTGTLSFIDVKNVPGLAFTRPVMASPSNSTLNQPVTNDNVSGTGSVKEENDVLKSRLLSYLPPAKKTTSLDGSGGGGFGEKQKRQYVTFTRPTLKSGGGLFSDPTFNQPHSDTETPGTDADADKAKAKPGLLSNGSVITSSTNPENVESYSHTVNVMSNSVTVKGHRLTSPTAATASTSTATANGMLGDGVRGKTAAAAVRKPATFENVHVASTSRSLGRVKRGVFDSHEYEY